MVGPEGGGVSRHVRLPHPDSVLAGTLPLELHVPEICPSPSHEPARPNCGQRSPVPSHGSGAAETPVEELPCHCCSAGSSTAGDDHPDADTVSSLTSPGLSLWSRSTLCERAGGGHSHTRRLRRHPAHRGLDSSHFFFRDRHVRHPALVRECFFFSCLSVSGLGLGPDDGVLLLMSTLCWFPILDNHYSPMDGPCFSFLRILAHSLCTSMQAVAWRHCKLYGEDRELKMWCIDATRACQARSRCRLSLFINEQR